MKDPRWEGEGRRKGAKYLIVVCDTFDHSDYPKYAYSEEEKNQIVRGCTWENMQRVMEVIEL